MKCSKIKILFYLVISLLLLLAPLALGIDFGGEANAMGFLGKKAGNGKSSAGRMVRLNPGPKNEQPPGEFQPQPSRGTQPAPAPVPEPATLLLVGAGAVGMAAFKKKFKKKQ